jgi:hypothetical protein
MRTIGTSGVIAVLFALVVAGCGGSAASSAPADAGTGAGSGSGAAATPDGGTGNGAAATPDSGTGTGGGSADDAANVGGQLKPPNSTETSKTTMEGYWYAIYHSSDAPDALKSFYEGEIPKTGLKIISTTAANGSYSWLIARDESGDFGGSVTVAPGGSGSGSDVIVGIGSN